MMIQRTKLNIRLLKSEKFMSFQVLTLFGTENQIPFIAVYLAIIYSLINQLYFQ